MSNIDFNELKEWINNWFYANKYYHPHSKSNSIPISELYDIFDRFEKCKREEYAMTENLTQLDKLEKYLKENGIKYERIDTKDTHQINVPNSRDKEWDAICHYGSFGYKEGLLEIYGSIVPENVGDTVEGYLTAEDVVNRINEYKKKNRSKKVERNCDKCIFSTRSGGCVSWNCEFIDIREAEKAWKSLTYRSTSR